VIDTHTHIYLDEFDKDRTEVMERSLQAGVNTWILPAIDATTHDKMVRVEQEFAGCRAMIGLHPCSVNHDFEKELKLVEDWLSRRSFIAIGEIGLDFYWDRTFTEQQYAAFRRQCAMAMERDLPIAIHSRESIDESISVVEEFPGLRGVFHCFSGNIDQARRIMETGFYLGIGGVVSFKNAGLDRVVAEIGLDRLVLETDAPYLAPVPFRGKRNEPSYTALVAKKISELLDRSLVEVEEITSKNARNLFGL
jgi:TatD DNase family protein